VLVEQGAMLTRAAFHYLRATTAMVYNLAVVYNMATVA
jgi:hypothetical protein